MSWGDWHSVTCYACGLATIDPESDEEVSDNLLDILDTEPALRELME